MPSEYKMADLPTPKDNQVTLEEVPPKIFAVIWSSGLGREAANNKMAKELQDWLSTQKDYEIVMGPTYAGYDPPWAIPLFRRNEMMYEVRSKK